MKVPIYSFTKDGKTYKVVGLAGHIIKIDYPPEYNRWKQVSLERLVEAEPVKKAAQSDWQSIPGGLLVTVPPPRTETVR